MCFLLKVVSRSYFHTCLVASQKTVKMKIIQPARHLFQFYFPPIFVYYLLKLKLFYN